jgi:hypothetical protein
MKKEPQDEQTPRASEERKLPYERPAVTSDEVFETLALSCSMARFACIPGQMS